MTGVVIDIGGGQIVEFPDATTAQQFMQSQGGAGQPAAQAPTPEASPRTGVAGFFLGDGNPETMNTGERFGEALNAAGEAMTMGLVGDEVDARLRSWVTGRPYEETLQQSRDREAQFAEESPVANGVSRLAGSMLPVLLPGGQAGTARQGVSLGRNMATGAGVGAGMGATYGFMEGEGGFQERLSEGGIGGLLGGVVGAAVPALGAGFQALRNSRANSRAVREAASGAPTTEELRQMGTAAYRQIDDAGVQIAPDSFGRFASELDGTLTSNGLDRLPGPGSLTPRAARVNQITQEMDQAMSAASVPTPSPTALGGPGVAQPNSVGLPFSSLDQLRRHAGTAASQVAPEARTDARLGSMTIEALDDFVNRLGPDDVVAGDVSALQEMIPRARDVWSRMSRSQMIDDAVENSENYLSGGASGIRNQFASILRNPRMSRSFSEQERALMRRVAQGSIPQQMLNLAGGGIGNIAQVGFGASLGGLPGAVAGLGTSAGARYTADRMTRSSAEVLRALIANGGMPEAVQANPTITRLAEGLMLRGGAVGTQ